MTKLFVQHNIICYSSEDKVIDMPTTNNEDIQVVV